MSYQRQTPRETAEGSEVGRTESGPGERAADSDGLGDRDGVLERRVDLLR